MLAFFRFQPLHNKRDVRYLCTQLLSKKPFFWKTEKYLLVNLYYWWLFGSGTLYLWHMLLFIRKPENYTTCLFEHLAGLYPLHFTWGYQLYFYFQSFLHLLLKHFWIRGLCNVAWVDRILRFYKMNTKLSCQERQSIYIHCRVRRSICSDVDLCLTTSACLLQGISYIARCHCGVLV